MKLNSERLTEAQQIGKEMFSYHTNVAPAMPQALQPLLADLPLGSGIAADVMRAYERGWQLAHDEDLQHRVDTLPEPTAPQIIDYLIRGAERSIRAESGSSEPRAQAINRIQNRIDIMTNVRDKLSYPPLIKKVKLDLARLSRDEDQA